MSAAARFLLAAGATGQLNLGRRDQNGRRARLDHGRSSKAASIVEATGRRLAKRHNQRWWFQSDPTETNLVAGPREPIVSALRPDGAAPPANSSAGNEKATVSPGDLVRKTSRAAVDPNDRPDDEAAAGRLLVPYEAARAPASGDDHEELLYYLHTPHSWLERTANGTAGDQQQRHPSPLGKQNSTIAGAANATTGGPSGGLSADANVTLSRQHVAGEANKRKLVMKKPYPYDNEVRAPFCLGQQQSEIVFAWECQGYQLGDIPAELEPKPNSLRLSKTGLEVLAVNALRAYGETLRDFSIEHSPKLTRVEPHVFRGLTKLRVVYIFRAHRLKSFDLAITGKHPDLTTIRIQQTGLTTWPDLSQFEQQKILSSIDLDNNQIKTLGSKPINIRAELVNLEFNLIDTIEESTFDGSEIAVLSLSGNRLLTSIHMNAFANLKNLIKLDLSGTGLSQLPTAGLHQLRSLVIRDNYLLKQIPSIYVFPMLEEAHLTYAHHCCSFRYPQTHDPSAYEEHVRLQEEINSICSKRMHSGLAPAETGPTGAPGADKDGVPAERRHRRAAHPSMEATSAPPTAGKPPSEHEPDADFEGSFGETKHDNGESSLVQPRANDSWPGFEGNMSAHPIEGKSSLTKEWLLQNIECGELVMKPNDTRSIACTPEPDAFNPCEDIMGYSVLRVAVWFVVAASIFGNLSVIFVLLGIFNRLSVPKFLQLNLAIGDLFMGVYLALLAVADLTTVGSYFNHAIDWQLGWGCQVAGASSLFASQLSIFTLSVITFERYYTITYSIDLNMRLQLGWAARIMLIGWIYAFASAMLPIFANINSYSKTSICLPLRTVHRLDRVFIIVLLIADSSVFLIIFVCYLKMYLLILRQKTEATLKERTVAMRMALLVFTDFACWAPIIFFGATAVMGHPLISVTNSKILIVFFYPLNSMANPFLYVISTRQYRRDLHYVLSRLRHWRKNLFKKRVDQTNFYNLANNPYGLPGHQYPAGLSAHLNAVAAVTGVADHLRHYKLTAHQQHNEPVLVNCEHNQLIKISNGSNELDQPQSLLDSDSNAQERNGFLRLPNGQRAAVVGGRNQASSCQFIVRHQILTSKHAPPGVRISNHTSSTTLSNCHTRRRLLEKIHQTRRQRRAASGEPPTGEAPVESGAENETSSNANIETEGNKLAQKGDVSSLAQSGNFNHVGAGCKVYLSCRDGQPGRRKYCTFERLQSSASQRRAGSCQDCRDRCLDGTKEDEPSVLFKKSNGIQHRGRNRCGQETCKVLQGKPLRERNLHLANKRRPDFQEATSSSQPEPEPTTTTTATSELTTTSADALLLPTSFDSSASIICVCSMDEITSNTTRPQEENHKSSSVSEERTSSSDAARAPRDPALLQANLHRSRQCHHRHHHHHHRHHHHGHHSQHHKDSKCRHCQTKGTSFLEEERVSRRHRSDEQLAVNCLHPNGLQQLTANRRPKSDDGINRHQADEHKHHSRHQLHHQLRAHSNDHEKHHHRSHHHHHHHGHHRRRHRRHNCDVCCPNDKTMARENKVGSVGETKNHHDAPPESQSKANQSTRLHRLMIKSSNQHQASSTMPSRRLERNLKPVIECATDADEQQVCQNGS